MDWGARLRAAWRGDVPDADLSAMFAATSGLDDLRQALADRRLAAQVAHPHEDWRALLEVAPLAAPLWLAESLVSLAGAFYDEETQARPQHAGTVSAYTHELVGRLLAPVEDIAAEVTAALADPSRRPALAVALHVGPGGDVADLPLPEPVTDPYLRALATAARRVHTSASSALLDTQRLLATAPGPSWLTVGLQRVDGALKASGARLDMDEVRLPGLIQSRAGNPAAPSPLCRDLWMVIDTACVAGQLIADPHLLPEAVAARPATPSEPRSASQRSAPPPPITPRQEWTPPEELPNIPEGAPPPGARVSSASIAANNAYDVAQHEVTLPAIGPDGQSIAGRRASDPPSGGPSLPSIGQPGAPAPAAPRRGDPDPRDKSKDGDEPGFKLPEIG